MHGFSLDDIIIVLALLSMPGWVGLVLTSLLTWYLNFRKINIVLFSILAFIITEALFLGLIN